jgi:hypothetical protein
MKFITRANHSVLDYMVSIILITVPFTGGADRHSAAFFAPVILGTLTIVISVFTNYEGGLVKLIPFRIHLIADVMQALMLGLSPWIFGLSGKTMTALIVGAILEIGIVLFTDLGKQSNDPHLTAHRLTRLRQKWSR